MYNPLEDNLPDSHFIMDKLEGMKKREQARDFVESTMIRLAEKGELYLTGFMMQGPFIKDLVGEIILGQTYTRGRQMHNIPVDPALDDYKVQIEHLGTSKTVVYKDGRRKSRTARLRNALAGNTNKGAVIDSPHFVETRQKKLSLKQAYKALKQSGLFVAAASSDKKHKLKYCQIREVAPWEKKDVGESGQAKETDREVQEVS